MWQRIGKMILFVGVCAGLASGSYVWAAAPTKAKTAADSGGHFLLAMMARQPAFFHYDIKKQADTPARREKLAKGLNDPLLPDLTIDYPSPGKLLIGTHYSSPREHAVQFGLVDKKVQAIYGPARETRREKPEVTLGDIATTKDMITEQLKALNKTLTFNYTFPNCNDPKILLVKFTGIKDDATKARLIKDTVPKRGQIAFRFLPKGYQIAVVGAKKDQAEQYLVKDDKKNTLTTAKALTKGTRGLRGQNLLPFPKIIRSKSSWTVTYTLKPNVVKNFAQLIKDHKGEYLIFAIDNSIYNAVKQPSVKGNTITVKVKPPTNAKQTELFLKTLNSRPLPVPLAVQVNLQQ